MVFGPASMNIVGVFLEIPYVVAYVSLVMAILYLCSLLSTIITTPGLVLGLALFYRNYKTIEEIFIAREINDDERKKEIFVVIIGGGFSGICAAVKLKLRGIRFVLLEKSSSLGGTWFENAYPGSGCDTMAHLYSYSFRPNPFWSRFNPGQSELLQYLKDTCEYYHILEDFKFNTCVEKCIYNETTARWSVFTSQDATPIQGNFIISAVGLLHIPKFPDFPGQDKFQGDSFHTSRWKKDFDVTNKKVAVIGTACSGVQVIPAIASKSKQVLVFQKTPSWVLPIIDAPYPGIIKEIFRAAPFIMKLHRLYILLKVEMIYFLALTRDSLSNRLLQLAVQVLMKLQVKDKELGKTLIPKYTMGCKRITVSNKYMSIYNRPNVTLKNTTDIKEITEDGIALHNGDRLSLDAIIYSTGFDTISSMLGGKMTVERPSDQKTLKEIWSDKPTAYMGTFCPGFPNYFVLLGPSTESGK